MTVYYLQDTDVGKDGELLHARIPKDKPAIVMVKASWCGFCTKTMPNFEQFSNQYSDKVFTAVINHDGTVEGEKELGKRVTEFAPNFRGFPAFLKYKGGKIVDMTQGYKDVDALVKFMQS